MASKYYPLRQWQSRSDVREVFKYLESRPASHNLRDGEKVAFAAVMKRLQAGGWDVRSAATPMVSVAQESQGVLCWGEWAVGGKRILDFTPELTQAFLNSDSSDMRIEDVEPEYTSQYLRFQMPADEPILFSDGNVVFEGAFVTHAPGYSMRITLTGRPSKPYPVDQAWRERYDLRVKAEHFGKPAQEAIDLALADDLADLRGHISGVRAQGGDKAAAEGELLMARQQADHGAFRSALQLVLNACAYLKIEAEDNMRRWPDDAPSKLVRQFDEGSPKELERAKSKLWALGHVPIFHIGEEFGRKYRAPDAGVRAHWRRGHFRRQAHGPEMSLRKLIWLRPMLVSSAKIDGEPPPPPKSAAGPSLG